MGDEFDNFKVGNWGNLFPRNILVGTSGWCFVVSILELHVRERERKMKK